MITFKAFLDRNPEKPSEIKFSVRRRVFFGLLWLEDEESHLELTNFSEFCETLHKIKETVKSSVIDITEVRDLYEDLFNVKLNSNYI